MTGGTPGEWWGSAPELTMTVACEGTGHRLRWRRGMMELLDHPELDAELALVALGGREPACLSLHRLWAEALADGGFLAEWVDESRLSPSWFSWLTMALERMRTEGFHEFLRGLPPARAQRMGAFLHQFPVPWIDRAAAAVSQAICEGDGVVCHHAPGLLSAAVAQRLRRAFVDSVGGNQLAVGAAALVPLTISVTPDSPPSVAGALTGGDRGVAITVDRSWLHQVWAAGGTVIDRRLTLALSRGAGGEDGLAAPTAALVSWHRSLAGGWAPSIDECDVRFSEGRWSAV